MNIFQWLETQPDQLAMFSAYNAAATKMNDPSLEATLSALFPKSETTASAKGHEMKEEPLSFIDVGGVAVKH